MYRLLCNILYHKIVKNFNKTHFFSLGVYYNSVEDENWTYMFSKLKHETDASEKNKLMIGLANVESVEKLTELVLSLLLIIFTNVYSER